MKRYLPMLLPMLLTILLPMLLLLPACERPEPVVEEAFVKVSRKVVEVGGRKQVLSVEVQKNTNFLVKDRPEWLSYLGEEKSGASATSVQLRFKVPDFVDPAGRQGSVRLQYILNSGQLAYETFTVIQHAAELDSELRLTYQGGTVVQAPLLQGTESEPYFGFVHLEGQDAFAYKSTEEYWKLSSGPQVVRLEGTGAAKVKFKTLASLDEIDFSKF